MVTYSYSFGVVPVVTLDAESGNRAIDAGNCWAFGAHTYTNSPTSVVINGNWSVRSNQLTNVSPTASWIKTPWMKIGSGNILFKAKTDGAPGTWRSIEVAYVPYDQASLSSSKEGARTVFYTFNFPTPITNTTLHNLSIPIPAAIENSTGAYKIMFSFIGEGGTGRAITDDYVIPGIYWSDPSNSCLPLPLFAPTDTDGDGVPDVDDEYPTDANRAYNSYYPSSLSWASLAFEDNWPAKGDYDFNDAVIDYRVKTITNSSNNVVDLSLSLRLRAAGAVYKNGFGLQLDGISPNKVSGVTGNQIGSMAMAANGTESGQLYATVIAFDDFFRVMPKPGVGIGVNTDKKGPYIAPVVMDVNINFINNGTAPSGGTVSLATLNPLIYNFFLFVNSIRGAEVHLPDRAPTSKAAASMLGTKDDTSNPSSGRYYRTSNNLPWAIEILETFDYTIEKAPIDEGHLKFVQWAESAGVLFPDWFRNNPGYRNAAKIY